MLISTSVAQTQKIGAALSKQLMPNDVLVLLGDMQENLKEEIIGKWQPVCGAKHPIEITKYGTIIQHWAKGHNSRFDYTLNGNQLDIRYNECKVEVVKNKSNTYLEIYNDNEFSGLYLKTK